MVLLKKSYEISSKQHDFPSANCHFAQLFHRPPFLVQGKSHDVHCYSNESMRQAKLRHIWSGFLWVKTWRQKEKIKALSPTFSLEKHINEGQAQNPSLTPIPGLAELDGRAAAAQETKRKTSLLLQKWVGSNMSPVGTYGIDSVNNFTDLNFAFSFFVNNK